MEYLEELQSLDQLRDPVLITGFMMRRRAGRLGARTVDYLVESWRAEPLARIDMTPFLNLAIHRPFVRRTESETLLEWPDATVFLARKPPLTRDILLLSTWEPDFKWKTFANTLTAYLDRIGIRTLVSLRGRPGEVPHTRPAPVYLTATDIDLELQFGVQSTRTRNEGPSSIAGVLATQVQAMRWRTAELAVVQPDYFPRMPNAEAMIALVRLIDKAFGSETDVKILEETARDQLEMLDRGTAGDAHSASVIAEREQTYDQGLEKLDFLAPSQGTLEPTELPSGAEILEEVEKLFRRSESDD
jgi:predicted ATP-grasp superfamily ATP-dependent carboligase